MRDRGWTSGVVSSSRPRLWTVHCRGAARHRTSEGPSGDSRGYRRTCFELCARTDWRSGSQRGAGPDRSHRERCQVHYKQSLVVAALFDGLIGFFNVLRWRNLRLVRHARCVVNRALCCQRCPLRFAPRTAVLMRPSRSDDPMAVTKAQGEEGLRPRAFPGSSRPGRGLRPSPTRWPTSLRQR